jgi:hypothetical protein
MGLAVTVNMFTSSLLQRALASFFYKCHIFHCPDATSHISSAPIAVSQFNAPPSPSSICLAEFLGDRYALKVVRAGKVARRERECFEHDHRVVYKCSAC